jgi:hypothetical protein
LKLKRNVLATRVGNKLRKSFLRVKTYSLGKIECIFI